jgi:hypothetical protein
MNLLNVDDIQGSGITIITNDNRALYDRSDLTQEDLDAMCDELIAVFSKYSFTVDMVLENEVAARMMGKIMFNKMFGLLDQLYIERS